MEEECNSDYDTEITDDQLLLILIFFKLDPDLRAQEFFGLGDALSIRSRHPFRVSFGHRRHNREMTTGFGDMFYPDDISQFNIDECNVLPEAWVSNSAKQDFRDYEVETICPDFDTLRQTSEYWNLVIEEDNPLSGLPPIDEIEKAIERILQWLPKPFRSQDSDDEELESEDEVDLDAFLLGSSPVLRLGSDGVPHTAVSPTQKLAARGLTNIGNTCFINAAVQTLKQIRPAFNYFTSANWELGLDTRTKTLAFTFRSVLLEFSRQGRNPISTTAFGQAVRKAFPQFPRNREADTREFLEALFDSFGITRNVMEQSSTEEAITLVQQILVNQVVEGKCEAWDSGVQSRRGDPEVVLLLSIKRERTLEALLDAHFSENVVTANCRYHLDHQQRIEQRFLRDLPQYLLISYKVAARSERGRIVKHPAIPTRKRLDLMPYLHPELRQHASFIQTEYALIAVSRHYGADNAGHYTTVAFEADEAGYCWREYSDGNVKVLGSATDPSKDTVEIPATGTDYVLLYRRRAVTQEERRIFPLGLSTQIVDKPPPSATRQQEDLFDYCAYKWLTDHPAGSIQMTSAFLQETLQRVAPGDISLWVQAFHRMGRRLSQTIDEIAAGRNPTEGSQYWEVRPNKLPRHQTYDGWLDGNTADRRARLPTQAPSLQQNDAPASERRAADESGDEGGGFFNDDNDEPLPISRNRGNRQ
jgi:hypothetical protein